MSQDVKIKVTLTGTGTSQGVPLIGCHCDVCSSEDPRDKRLRSSVLLQIHGHNFVVDAGPDFRQQMLTYRVDTLRAILLTHEHVDHIFGLDDIRSYNWLQRRPADIYAEPRVHEAIRRIFHYVFARDRYPGIPQMKLHEISGHPFKIDGVEFIPIRVYHHKLPVLGFRVGGFTYITDANSIPEEEMHKLYGTRVFVVNALRMEKHLSHFSLEEALELADRIRPERIWFTHVSHSMGLAKDIQRKLPPNAGLAWDGLTFDV